MQLKNILIEVEEQSDKYHFSDSMISASQKQNQMHTRKKF